MAGTVRDSSSREETVRDSSSREERQETVPVEKRGREGLSGPGPPTARPGPARARVELLMPAMGTAMAMKRGGGGKGARAPVRGPAGPDRAGPQGGIRRRGETTEEEWRNNTNTNANANANTNDNSYNNTNPKNDAENKTALQ